MAAACECSFALSNVGSQVRLSNQRECIGNFAPVKVSWRQTNVFFASSSESEGGARATGAKRGRGRKKDPKLAEYLEEPMNAFVPQAMDWIHKDAHTYGETLCNHYGNEYLATAIVAKEAQEYWTANLGHDERLRFILQRSIKAAVEKTRGINPAWEPMVSIVDFIEEDMERIWQAETAEASEEEETGESEDDKETFKNGKYRWPSINR